MERWRDIKGYGGRYQVSDAGRVRSMPKHNRLTVKILKPFINKKGYAHIVLDNKGHLVHRLVLSAFVCESDTKKEVNHIDGIKDNNILENLEWCTKSENTLHAYTNKLMLQPKGEAHPVSKLTELDIRNIFRLKELGLSNAEIGRRYSTPRSNIRSIINRETWSHVNIEGVH